MKKYIFLLLILLASTRMFGVGWTPTDGGPVSGPRNMRRSSGWGDPDDDLPIGVTPNQTPVGEPLILLLMAFAYALYLRLRRTPVGKR